MNAVTVFYCPACKEPAGICHAYMVLPWSLAGLSIPYFVCPKCMLQCVSKSIIRKCIRDWRCDSEHAKELPFVVIHKEVMTRMNRIMEGRQTMGYKPARFRTTPVDT